MLTHWGWVTHIYVCKLTIIGSDNGLSPDRRPDIIWTNAGILLIWTLGTNFSEILSEIHTFSFKKMHLKLSSAKGRSFCISLNVLVVERPQSCAKPSKYILQYQVTSSIYLYNISTIIFQYHVTINEQEYRKKFLKYVNLYVIQNNSETTDKSYVWLVQIICAFRGNLHPRLVKGYSLEIFAGITSIFLRFSAYWVCKDRLSQGLGFLDKIWNISPLLYWGLSFKIFIPLLLRSDFHQDYGFHDIWNISHVIIFVILKSLKSDFLVARLHILTLLPWTTEYFMLIMSV